MDNDNWTYDPMADGYSGIPIYPPGPDTGDATVYAYGKSDAEAVALAERICGLLNADDAYPEDDNDAEALGMLRMEGESALRQLDTTK